MKRVPLKYGGCFYWDRTQPLLDKAIQPANIDLNYTVLEAAELGRRVGERNEFEAGEMYACSYIIQRARGDQRLVGLPVFPSRSFRHGYIFVRTGSGIERPEDLAGRRVGVGQYAITATMWVRAFLQHDYGVSPTAIHWVEGGMWEPDDFSGHAAVELPPDIQVSRGGHQGLEPMLLNGEIDALISPHRPRALVGGDSRIRRLFANYPDIEKDYFRRTGFFPIMHLLVLRREIYERHRWLAKSLFDAFEEAKVYSRKRMQDTSALAVGLPWLPSALEEVDDLFRGDAFPYGFEANLPVLKAMIEYMREQGMIKQKLDPETLFAPEVLF